MAGKNNTKHRLFKAWSFSFHRNQPALISVLEGWLSGRMRLHGIGYDTCMSVLTTVLRELFLPSWSWISLKPLRGFFFFFGYSCSQYCFLVWTTTLCHGKSLTFILSHSEHNKQTMIINRILWHLFATSSLTLKIRGVMLLFNNITMCITIQSQWYNTRVKLPHLKHDMIRFNE